MMKKKILLFLSNFIERNLVNGELNALKLSTKGIVFIKSKAVKENTVDVANKVNSVSAIL